MVNFTRAEDVQDNFALQRKLWRLFTFFMRAAGVPGRG